MTSLYALCFAVHVAATAQPSPKDGLRLEASVLAGVDSNAEQSSRTTGFVGALDAELEFEYARWISERLFGAFEAEADLALFAGEVEASRASVDSSLSLGRYVYGRGPAPLVGGRRTNGSWLRFEVHVGYGLAVRIDGSPPAPPPVWTRGPDPADGSEAPLPDLADDDVFDPDTSLTGPAVAFLQPLHDLKLMGRLRWVPSRGTRIDLEPGFSAGAAGGRPRRSASALRPAGGRGRRSPAADATVLSTGRVPLRVAASR